MNKKPVSKIDIDELPALQATTWEYCWRCGKRINLRNSNEVRQGYHNRCDPLTNRNSPVVRIHIQIGLPS